MSLRRADARHTLSELPPIRQRARRWPRRAARRATGIVAVDDALGVSSRLPKLICSVADTQASETGDSLVVLCQLF
jgi:hypothetical protein